MQGGRYRFQIVVEQACVDVQCHRHRGMPEHLLHRLDVGPGADGEAGRGVPEIVRVVRGTSDPATALANHPDAGWGPFQVPAVITGPQQRIAALPFTLTGQKRHQERGQRERALFVGLGGADGRPGRPA
jgi:hypothetical protein